MGRRRYDEPHGIRRRQTVESRLRICGSPRSGICSRPRGRLCGSDFGRICGSPRASAAGGSGSLDVPVLRRTEYRQILRKLRLSEARFGWRLPELWLVARARSGYAQILPGMRQAARLIKQW